MSHSRVTKEITRPLLASSFNLPGLGVFRNSDKNYHDMKTTGFSKQKSFKLKQRKMVTWLE